MCGIAGILDWQERPDRRSLQAMGDALAHRGPDAHGIWADESMGLCHRRLSIVDLAPSADQPMADVEGNIHVVFNGEIYNYRELRIQLEAKGHIFRTESDTEVLIESYKAWDFRCVEHFNGMFAFGLWDRQRRRLMLARDRAGEKPLFLASIPNGFAFASEPNVLRRLHGVNTEIDASGLTKYLTSNYIPGGGTLTKGIRKTRPGSVMLFERNAEPKTHHYWSILPAFGTNHHERPEAAAEKLAGLIDDATRMRLVADVPVGAFLSGGVDSATVVASMAHSSPAVHTFSVGFSHSTYDEVSQARATAAWLGVQHAAEIIDLDVPSIIAAIRHAATEPLADNSVVPSWLLARQCRRHMKVALSGDGADELFGGYETYSASLIAEKAQHVPRWVWSRAGHLTQKLIPVSFAKISWDYKLRHFLKGMSRGWPSAHFAWRNIFDEAEISSLLCPEWRGVAVDGYEDFTRAWNEAPANSSLDRAMYVDLQTWLLDDVLVKVDRMSMAHGLEVRTPFLDHRVMEYAASLAPSLKVRGTRKKIILKKSQQGRLPGDVLNRGKSGFNAPMSDWLLGPLHQFARDSIASKKLDAFFNRLEIDRLWEQHNARKRDNGYKLFGLLCFALWLG